MSEKHEFELMEDAVIAALNPLISTGLKTLEPYADQLTVEEMEEMTLQFPCIYVVASGLKLDVINRYGSYDMGLTLIVGDRNLRGAEDATRGDVSSPGVFELLRAARELLHNKKVLPGWRSFYMVDEAPLVYAPKSKICVYIATYQTKTVK